jgi:hypothetical protein
MRVLVWIVRVQARLVGFGGVRRPDGECVVHSRCARRVPAFGRVERLPLDQFWLEEAIVPCQIVSGHLVRVCVQEKKRDQRGALDDFGSGWKRWHELVLG